MQKFEEKKGDYFEHALHVWKSIATNNFSAKDWVEEYDNVFKLVIADDDSLPYCNSRLVYEVYKQILEEQVVVLKKERFLETAKHFIRCAAYLDRFWIPNHKLPSLFEITKDVSRKNEIRLANFERSFIYWCVITKRRSIPIHKDIFPIISKMLEATKYENCWDN